MSWDVMWVPIMFSRRMAVSFYLTSDMENGELKTPFLSETLEKGELLST